MQNRRAVLGVLAAAPLLAAPDAAGEPHPDAALLAIGARLDEAVAAFLVERPAYQDAVARRQAALQAAQASQRFILPGESARPVAYPDVVSPWEAVIDRGNDLAEACDEICEEAITIAPRTIEGAAVIARVAHFWWLAAWEEPEGREYDDIVIVALVEGVLALAGVDRFGRLVEGRS